MSFDRCLCLSTDDLPCNEGWLAGQTCRVIAVGEGYHCNADLVVATDGDAAAVIRNIERAPLAAMTLWQLLRWLEHLPIEAAMSLESLGYATVQAGAEHQAWLCGHEAPPALITGAEGVPIIMERDGSVVSAQLNRAENRNAITVELRDALVDLLELVLLEADLLL